MAVQPGAGVRAVVVTLIAAAVACGGDDAALEDEAGDAAAAPFDEPAEMSPAGLTIVEPAEGDTVRGPTVIVRLDLTGISVAMAGDTTPNTGHHHLFLDRDVSAPDIPIPAEPGFIVHMGDASMTYTFENVAPGEHRLIAVVGDGLHYPLQPWVVDTVRFVVR